jgi:hypothetical protein
MLFDCVAHLTPPSILFKIPHSSDLVRSWALPRATARRLPAHNGFVSTQALSPVDLDRIESALGWRPTHWAPASGRTGGATAARLVVSSGDERAFVKLGTTELTAGWFRREHQNYLTLAGPFLPRLLGFSDDGMVPVLAIEDLSDATWPPPWDDELIAQVLDAVALVHAHPIPSHLAALTDEYRDDWDRLASDPQPFLALGLCSPSRSCPRPRGPPRYVVPLCCTSTYGATTSAFAIGAR